MSKKLWPNFKKSDCSKKFETAEEESVQNSLKELRALVEALTDRVEILQTDLERLEKSTLPESKEEKTRTTELELDILELFCDEEQEWSDKQRGKLKSVIENNIDELYQGELTEQQREQLNDFLQNLKVPVCWDEDNECWIKDDEEIDW